MSFEGTFQYLCSGGHLIDSDVYDIEPEVCYRCGKSLVWRYTMDQTNGYNFCEDAENFLEIIGNDGKVDLYKPPEESRGFRPEYEETLKKQVGFLTEVNIFLEILRSPFNHIAETPYGGCVGKLITHHNNEILLWCRGLGDVILYKENHSSDGDIIDSLGILKDVNIASTVSKIRKHWLSEFRPEGFLIRAYSQSIKDSLKNIEECSEVDLAAEQTYKKYKEALDNLAKGPGDPSLDRDEP